MKIVSWAIIFVIVIFSFSFINRVILNDKMEIMKEEVKYNNVLELAVADATSELKTQMNSIADTYEETQEMLLTTAKTFFDSFSMGLGYYGGNSKESLVKMYIPALAMMTYDGFYMYTLDYVDNAGNKYIEHTLKPETKYAYDDGISKINFTLDNTVILDKNVSIIDYSSPVMEPIYDNDIIAGYKQQKTNDGKLVYYIKNINTSKVVDLNHYYDIIKRDDGDTWDEQIGKYIFKFRKEGEVCIATNEKYKDIGSATWNRGETNENNVITYEKSFYMQNGIRYLLEEWRKGEEKVLIEQRMTEYTEEQMQFCQAIESNISNGSKKYGDTTENSDDGYVDWQTGFVSNFDDYSYLTRGNPENEGFVNPLTGEYEIGRFHKVRRELITQKIKDSLEYYILLHNKFAQNSGITYTFTMPEIKDTDWENAITDMSVFAFVQGIPMVSGKCYNNYGIAGAKVIEQEKFYGIPPETEDLAINELPTYYSNREIGSAKEYMFERNNARIYYDPKEAADYGYYPNIDGNIAKVEGIEKKVWKMEIVKDVFNCVKTGDVVTIPIVVSDDIIPDEIKWEKGYKSRYYFSNAGNTTNSVNSTVHYDTKRIVDDPISMNIYNGTDITWQYKTKNGERVILIVLNAGTMPATTTTYTVYIRDIEGNTNIAEVTLQSVDSNPMTITQTPTSKEDNDDNPIGNIISGYFNNRIWSNLHQDVNGKYMAYWMKGKIDAGTINSYYSKLINGEVISGVNQISGGSGSSWSFTVNEYGHYTVFAWDCTGATVAADIVIYPKLQITYVIDAYNKDDVLKETIKYDANGNIISGSTDIEEEITKGKISIKINRTEEQLKYVEYKKGNFDVIARTSEGIEKYIQNTGTNIKGINKFEVTENNYYTVYVEDDAGTKRCVQINFELITSAFIPDFTTWIIPDINYQKDKKTGTNYWCSLYNPPINVVDSRTLNFGSYYSQNYNDIIFTTADPKYEIVFKFTINDKNVSYHSSKGAGFLFDCTVNNSNRTDGYVDYNSTGGYLLLYESSSIVLYKLSNNNLTEVRASGVNMSGTDYEATKIVSATSGYYHGGVHETRLEIRQINDTEQSLILKEKKSSGDWDVLMNATIEHNKQTENAYGVIMMHNSHACSEQSKFQFDNMSIIQKDYIN